ncbi:MAG: methyltransferase domain-containing protein [Acidobacteriota bacterium]|nr:methyltransferase domain-containing protein [Acidobacteriota bacterium]
MGIQHPGVLAMCVIVSVGVGLRAQHHEPAAGQHKPDHMEHRFDDPARYAKQFDDPARDAWQMPERVIEALAIAPGQAIADIGAGTGYFSSRLAKSPSRPTVYAVDIEPSMVAYLRDRAAKEGLKNLTPVQAGPDGPNLPVPVDTVLVVDTYHHIPKRVEYFRALQSSIKPGGRLAIVDFRKDAPDGPPVEFRFTPDEMSAELRRAGFVLAAQHDFLPRQMFLIYRVE